MAWQRRRTTSVASFGLLIIHIIMTAAIFASVLTAGWLTAFLPSYLDSVHKFPRDVYRLAIRVEVWFFYLDCMLSAFVLMASIVPFVRSILEEKR